MAGPARPIPAIHVFASLQNRKDVDARVQVTQPRKLSSAGMTR
jgi:hypothetical protein